MTRSTGSRYRDQLPPESPGQSEPPLQLIRSIVLACAIVALGVLAISWITSDYSGEYVTQDAKLGHITLELIRHPTSVGGSIAIGSGVVLDIIDGHVSNDNHLELSFSPKGESDDSQRFITGSFQGEIDPHQEQQDSVSLSFDQVLAPYQDEHSKPASPAVTLPRMSVQQKVIAGILTYNGTNFPLALSRDSLSSIFRQLKSHWPGSS